MLENTNNNHHSQVSCHECDNRVVIPQLKHHQKALCPRCGFQLTVFRRNAIDKIIACSLAALIFLVAAIPYDFLSFSSQGQEQSINIPSSISVLIDNDYLLLAIIQVLAIVVLPAVILLGLLYLTVPLKFATRPPYGERVMKWVFALIPWSMAEIFLVGVLVSLIKIVSLADIGLGLSFYAYVFFTLAMTFTLLFTDKHQLSHLLSETPTRHIQPLKPWQSIQYTWALLVTSVLLYIPANLLPIMNTRFLGQDEPNTILGGVIVLWQSGSYPVALIIFIASVFVPVMKLIILCWLNYSVQKGFRHTKNERVFWYRVTELIGRWSMVDVFVVAILVSLIQLGNTMSIYPGPAALAFCGVVIATMLAAITFDTRLIWQQDALAHE